MTVYVRWYGNVVQGELLDGECMGMKQVRIPLDGHKPIALFTPGHVYEAIEAVPTCYPVKDPNIAISEMIKGHYEISQKESVAEFIEHTIDMQRVENFKRDNWDQEHNHLRIDKLDEFYKLWRIAMTPSGFVEAEAPKRIVSDEKMEELKQQLKEKLDKLPEPHPAPKPVRQKPSKKMLRSTGVQQFNDSTQLSLFE